MRCLSWVLPFLGEHWLWRYGVLRHLALGTVLALLWVPAGMLCANFVLRGQLSAVATLWFSVIYCSSLPLAAIPLGLLGFAVAPNYARVAANMATPDDEPSPIWRLARRALHAPRC